MCMQKNSFYITSNGPILLVWVTHNKFELARQIGKLFIVKPRATVEVAVDLTVGPVAVAVVVVLAVPVAVPVPVPAGPVPVVPAGPVPAGGTASQTGRQYEGHRSDGQKEPPICAGCGISQKEPSICPRQGEHCGIEVVCLQHVTGLQVVPVS